MTMKRVLDDSLVNLWRFGLELTSIENGTVMQLAVGSEVAFLYR